MKEALHRIISPVMENQLVQKLLANDFLCGILTGILLVFFIRIFWSICFRRKSLSCIQIENAGGSITITSAAVFNVIKYAAADIRCLELNRLRIFQGKNMLTLELRASIKDGESPVTLIMEQLSAVIRKQLNSFFGVEKSYELKLNISNCKKCKSSDEANDDTDMPEFIDAVENDRYLPGNRTVSIKPPVKDETGCRK